MHVVLARDFFLAALCDVRHATLQGMHTAVFNTLTFCKILAPTFSHILRADLDEIQTVNGSKFCAFTVLISFNSGSKIGEKVGVKVLQKVHVLKTAL